MSIPFYLSKIFIDVLKWVMITSNKTRASDILKKIELAKLKFLAPLKTVKNLEPGEEILVTKIIELIQSDVALLRLTKDQRTSYLRFVPALPDSGDIRCHITHRVFDGSGAKIRWTSASELTITIS